VDCPVLSDLTWATDLIVDHWERRLCRYGYQLQPSSMRRSLMPTNQQNESRKFHMFMGAVIALLTTADLLLARVVCYHGVAKTIIAIPVVLAFVAIGALPFVVICWEWRRKWFRTSLDLLSTAAWVLAVWILIGPLVQIAARSPAPLVDATLARIDSRTMQTVTVVRWLHDFPLLSIASQAAYKALWPLAIIALFLPILCGHARDVRHYLVATSISILLTLGLFALWPAIGPWTIEAFRPGKMQAQIGSYLSSLKSQAVPDGPELAGIVAFPSFHVILAILSTRALWGIGKLRPFCAALCVAICISTVATGWHYVIDVFAGIAVAAVSQRIASWALRTQPQVARRALSLNPAFTPRRAV